MSKNLETVIQRAISDAAFRRQLQANPEAALRGFKLTADEVAAIRSGDAGRLTSLGIDQRMSKTFAFGGDAVASRAAIGGDLTPGGTSITDTDIKRMTDLTPGSPSGSAAAIDPGNVSGRADLTPGTPSGSTAAIDPGNISGLPGVLVGDPTAGQAAFSDALEDQSFAFAASRPETVRSAVNDVDPVLAGDVSTSQAATSDALEDTSHAFAASRPETVRSAVNDIEPTMQSTGMVAPVEGSPEETAFNRGIETVRSAVHDVEPTLQSTGMVAPVEGSPEATAFAQQADPVQHISRVNDVAPIGEGDAIAAVNTTDTTGIASPDSAEAYAPSFHSLGASAPSSDAIEDLSHAAAANAFLTEGEATQYTADPNWSSDLAEDTSHAFNPDATGIAPGGTESGTHGDNEISS